MPGARPRRLDGLLGGGRRGGIPYGDAQIARFPKVVDPINADPAVQLVDHLGDIKSGILAVQRCLLRDDQDPVRPVTDPLVYTPGDNEWTDCHRPDNGSYNPHERLAAVRKVSFPGPAGRSDNSSGTCSRDPTPGRTLPVGYGSPSRH